MNTSFCMRSPYSSSQSRRTPGFCSMKALATDRNDDPEQGIMFRWRSHANLLFSNWLNYYLYQATPYNLDDLREGKEDAWRGAFIDERTEI